MARQAIGTEAIDGRRGDWPLVGRAEELEFLRGALRHSPPTSVVVSGAVGVGKSRLVRCAAEEAERSGWAALTVRASAGLTGVPLGSLRGLLAARPGRMAPSPSSHEGDLAELAADVERAIDERARLGPVLMVVDDAHDLDDSSAGLVHQMAAAKSITVLLTLRSGSPRPAAVTGLWKDGLAERFELKELSRREAGELVVAALGGEAEDTTVERLWQITQGNPLYLREVILASVESGALRQTDGVWRWRGKWATGDRLQEIVAERLGRLTPDEQAAVEALAVARSLPFSVLAELATPGALAKLEARTLLQVERSGRRTQVTLAHPVHAEVVRDSMAALQLRAVRHNLTESIGRAGAKRAEDQVRLACWSLDSGGRVDPVTLQLGADAALWHIGHAISGRLHELLPESEVGQLPETSPAIAADPALAVRLAQAAYDGGGGIPAGVALASTLAWVGDTGRAEEVLGDLERTAPVGGDRLRVAMARAELRFWGQSRVDDALSILNEAWRGAPADSDPDLLAALAKQVAGVELNTGRPADALVHARASAELAGAPLAESSAAASAAASLMFLGRCQEALALTDEAVPAAAARGEHTLVVPQLLFARVGALSRDGQFEAARELGEACREVAMANESLDGAALFGVAAAEALLRQGRPASAARLYRDAAGLLAERDIFGYRGWTLTGLSRARAMIGDEEGAAAALEQAERACTMPRHFDTWRYMAEAALHQLGGRRDAALDALRAGVQWARSSEMVVDEALILDAWLRLERSQPAVDRLASLPGVTDSGLVAALAAHGTALADDDAEGLMAASEQFQQMTAWWMAAEAAAAAAQRYERTRRQREAQAASRTARSLAEQCEGARSPLVQRLVAPAALTDRELEVARLAIAGHSSKVIAERLHLSTRTVDSHLYRTYVKLGVTDRAGLAAALEG